MKIGELTQVKTYQDYLHMQQKGFSTGTVVVGEGGIGKTYQATQILKDAAYLNTYTTPLSFYMFLYDHQHDHIIIDDVVALWENKMCLGMLKAALGEVGDKRIIQYKSTTGSLEGIPPEFIFKGTICSISNSLPRNEDINAVLSRINFIDLTLTYKEKIDCMEELCIYEYEGLSRFDRLEILCYLRERSAPYTDNLNFRTLFKAFDMRLYSESGWKTLVDGMLSEDEDLKYCHEALEIPDVYRQYLFFRSKTGKTKPYFYRCMHKLKKRLG